MRRLREGSRGFQNCLARTDLASDYRGSDSLLVLAESPAFFPPHFQEELLPDFRVNSPGLHNASDLLRDCELIGNGRIVLVHLVDACSENAVLEPLLLDWMNEYIN